MMQGKRTIIIIDPDVNLTEDLQRRFMLEPEFEIINTASMGMDGFAKVQRQQPQFVVISNPLPDADIIQLLSNINMVSPNTKKIVTMEIENPMFSSQCMQAGANYVLTKPYSADKLIEVIKALEKKPAGVQQPQGQFYSNPQQVSGQDMGGMGVGMGQAAGTGGTNSFEQLRAAMNQFAQQQQSGYGMGGGSMGSGGYRPTPTEPQDPSFNIGMNPNPYGNQNINQMGGDAMYQGFNNNFGGGFPPPQQPMSGMSGGMNPGMGMGMGMPYGQPDTSMMGMNTGGQQKGGFRTLKQTIIAVNCPKGGVGKTTISKELALAFSTVKVNGQPLKVCLVDCDLDFGDVTSMLKLNPYPNITHWTSDISQRLRENPAGEIKYTQQQIESKYLITHPTGLKVLSAPSNHTDALDITGKEMEIILDNLKNCDFDVIILDTGNNTKDYTLIALDKANVILMVTTLDVTTINDTNLLLNTLRSIQFPTSKIQLIVNRMPKTDKDIDVSEISQVLRSPIIGIIPDFPKIRQLNNNGTPAVLGKENEYTAAIRKIGNTIVPVFNRAVSHRQKSSSKQGGGSQGGGFFSKLFGTKK